MMNGIEDREKALDTWRTTRGQLIAAGRGASLIAADDALFYALEKTIKRDLYSSFTVVEALLCGDMEKIMEFLRLWAQNVAEEINAITQP